MLICGYCIESLRWWNRILINIFWKTALFDLIQPVTSLLLFDDNDFETSTYKCKLCQKMMISARKKDEMSKRWNGTHHRKNEWNECIFILSAGHRWKSCLQGSLHCFLIPGTLTSTCNIEIKARRPTTANSGTSLKNFAFILQLNSLSLLDLVSHFDFTCGSPLQTHSQTLASGSPFPL